jgi:hypothetical protein
MSDHIPSAQRSFDSQAPKDPQHVTDTPPDPSPRAAQTDVHPVAIEVALAAALWFIAATWVSFARGAEVDWTSSSSRCSSSSSSRCSCSPRLMP